ncbi:modification methylase [Bosea lupini]|uniref:Methyltransferase n=1 Tax=Bosea lupini TaxID=1036779 RepID=A0A1H8AFZ4_9HYPH|nr:DNA methyltransferase [Bosea lupini]SEM69406.1 modification methylase [Bosea lupini]
MSWRTEQLSDSVTLHCGDCREILPTLGKIDAVVSDPPYGMAWDTDSTRFTGGNRKRPDEGRADFGAITADAEPFDPKRWLAFPEVILWGANHFGARLPVGSTLVWIKKSVRAFGTFLSDAEIGWQKGGHGVYCKYVEFQGGLARKAENDGVQAAHPTQKPIDLMLWCVQRTKGRTILDPYMGSGTTGIACARLGRRFIGIVIEPKYFDTACRRLEIEAKQERLFAQAPAAPEPAQQMPLGLGGEA